MVTLDEAIQHALEKAEELKIASENAEIQGYDREATKCYRYAETQTAC